MVKIWQEREGDKSEHKNQKHSSAEEEWKGAY